MQSMLNETDLIHRHWEGTVEKEGGGGGGGGRGEVIGRICTQQQQQQHSDASRITHLIGVTVQREREHGRESMGKRGREGGWAYLSNDPQSPRLTTPHQTPFLHSTLPAQWSRPWRGSIRGDHRRQTLKIDSSASKEGNQETYDRAYVDALPPAPPSIPPSGGRWFSPPLLMNTYTVHILFKWFGRLMANRSRQILFSISSLEASALWEPHRRSNVSLEDSLTPVHDLLQDWT